MKKFFVLIVVLLVVASLSAVSIFDELWKDSEADAAVVQSMVEAGVDLNSGNSWGDTPLTYALNYCNEDVILALLSSDDIDVNQKNSYGTSPLLTELSRDSEAREDVISSLISKGANPNDGISWGDPPLIYSIRYCSNEITKCLISSSLIDVNLENTGGWNALMAELNEDDNADIEIVKLLIEKGANPNVGISWGDPPLIYSIRYCSNEITKCLISSSLIDVNLENTGGWNALMAELNEDDNADVEIVKLLIEKGANPNVGISWGDPPLIYSIRYCSNEITKSIISSSLIDVNLVNRSGWNALMAELNEDDNADIEIVKLLIEKGANPNVGTSWGYAPKEYASHFNSDEISALVSDYQNSFKEEDAPEAGEISEEGSIVEEEAEISIQQAEPEIESEPASEAVIDTQDIAPEEENGEVSEEGSIVEEEAEISIQQAEPEIESEPASETVAETQDDSCNDIKNPNGLQGSEKRDGECEANKPGEMEGEVSLDDDFDIDEETGYITGYYGDETELAVPETIDDVAVKGIDDWAFQACKQITSITLPEDLVFIGDHAFEYCTALVSVSIPDSVETIGISAFEGCEVLVSVSIPKKVTSIGDRAFKNCKSIRSLKAPNCLSTIGAEAFCGCSSLEAFRFTSRSRLASLGTGAFKDCSTLQAVSLANGLSKIPESAFENCANLASVKIPSNLESIGAKAFKNCRKLGALDIPETVTTIGEQAFHGCRIIASIVIPDSVTDIGKSAFAFCGGLKTQNLTSEQTQPLYKIGDMGPAGGMIFYVDEEDAYPEWDYLETPTGKNGIGEYQFGYYYVDGSKSKVGTGTGIGDGRDNTEKLVAAMGDAAWDGDGNRTVSTYAAKMCADYSVTRDGVVYDDWFLPSKYELDLIYQNLQKPGLSKFSGSWCWSSSENYNSILKRDAWFQNFYDGGQDYLLTTRNLDSYCVRPVRAF